jgi:hypothetical protein
MDFEHLALNRRGTSVGNSYIAKRKGISRIFRKHKSYYFGFAVRNIRNSRRNETVTVGGSTSKDNLKTQPFRSYFLNPDTN